MGTLNFNYKTVLIKHEGETYALNEYIELTGNLHAKRRLRKALATDTRKVIRLDSTDPLLQTDHEKHTAGKPATNLYVFSDGSVLGGTSNPNPGNKPVAVICPSKRMTVEDNGKLLPISGWPIAPRRAAEALSHTVAKETPINMPVDSSDTLL